MKNIEEFLKKFTVIKNPSNKKEEIVSVINKTCGCSLTKDNLILQGKKIIIHTHPTIKNLIFIKKTEVLIKIKEENPETFFEAIV